MGEHVVHRPRGVSVGRVGGFFNTPSRHVHDALTTCMLYEESAKCRSTAYPRERSMPVVKRLMVIILCLSVLSTVTGCYVGGANQGEPNREDEVQWRRWQRDRLWDWRLEHPHTPIAPQSEGD